MTPEQEKAVELYALGKVYPEYVLHEFGVGESGQEQLAVEILKEGYERQRANLVEGGLALAFHWGLGPEHLEILMKLSDCPWHVKHEDIVTALEEIGDPGATEALYRASQHLWPYLDYDDTRQLARKAIWALSKLGTAEASAKLELLESESELFREYVHEATCS